MQRARGFTLVELLITAAILAVVLITAGTFLIQSQRSQQATVDLGSRVDAQAFVSSLINYDFRIVCYHEDFEASGDCSIHIESDGKTIKVSYYEDRFIPDAYDKGVIKNITWKWDEANSTIIRNEYLPSFPEDSTNSVVLNNVKGFKGTNPSPQLLEFEIRLESDTKPININVAVLNQVGEN